MKRSGIINAPLAGHLARLGHTDLVVVADAGLPVPAHVPLVDLAIVFGLPRFTDVLDALLADIVVEYAWVSEQADGTPADAVKYVLDTELWKNLPAVKAGRAFPVPYTEAVTYTSALKTLDALDKALAPLLES